MKKIFFILLAILFSSQSAWATWTAGNHASARSSNGAGPTTSGIDTTGSNAVVVGIVNASGCATFVHDNMNSDALWRISKTTTVGGLTLTLWTINSDATFGAGHTFQAKTAGCLNYASILVLALNSGTATNGDFTDQTSTSSTSGTTLQAGSVTPTAANEIVISLLGIGIVNGAGYAIDSSFTLIEHQDQADFNQGGALAYKIQTTAVATNPQWSWNNSGAALAINASLFDKTGVSCTVVGSVYTASTLIGLEECFGLATHDGDSVHISGAGIHITRHVGWGAPTNATLYGDGVCTGSGDPNGGTSGVVTCDDATTITDDYPANDILMSISIPSTGTFTMRGLSFTGGLGHGIAKDSGVVAFFGPGSLRITQVHYDLTNESVGSKMMYIGNHVYGVMDHSKLKFIGTQAIYLYNGVGTDGAGNVSWTEDTGFGSENFFFIESNQIDGTAGQLASRTLDCFSASRGVLRFNTLGFMSGPETHATGHSPDDRGCRALETYNNHFKLLPGSTYTYALHDGSSGPSLFWGNNVDADSVKNGIIINVTRKNADTYHQGASPTNWGYCGTEFDGNSSVWDQNSDPVLGYACIDQPGRGKGQLLVGLFPSKINFATGTQIWPNQEVDPIYVWNNSFTPASGSGGSFYSNASGGRALPNRDYYEQASGVQVSASSPFDGTSGAGWGTRARRPATCTVGVGYSSTDIGSWNLSGAGGQGVLDKCTATNTWTTVYTPFTYPHPLVNPVNHLVFTVQPTDVATGGAFSPVVVVTVTDPDGMTDASATGNVVISINGCGASLTGTLTRAAVMGVATFTAMGASTAASGCILTASYTDITPGTSNSFSVNGASAPTLTSIQPRISVRGQTIPVTLTGTNLNTGNPTIVVSGTAFSVIPGSVAVVNSTTITARFLIAGNATTDVRTVSVTTDTGSSGNVNFSILNQGVGVRPR